MSTGAIPRLRALRARVLSSLKSLDWFALLLGRLAVGLVFLSTGWGKVHNLDGVTQFFGSLGIPAPGFNAVMVSWLELVCGATIVLGLLTRLSTVPLFVSMVVAILTAKRDKLHGLFDLVGFDEFTYAVVLVMLAVLGPGRASLDRLLEQRLDASGKS
jgi:putative oxidoreductase